MTENLNTDATIDRLRNVLVVELENRRLIKLSRNTGISLNTLYNMAHGRHRPLNKTVVRLLRALEDDGDAA